MRLVRYTFGAGAGHGRVGGAPFAAAHFCRPSSCTREIAFRWRGLRGANGRGGIHRCPLNVHLGCCYCSFYFAGGAGGGCATAGLAKRLRSLLRLPTCVDCCCMLACRVACWFAEGAVRALPRLRCLLTAAAVCAGRCGARHAIGCASGGHMCVVESAARWVGAAQPVAFEAVGSGVAAVRTGKVHLFSRMPSLQTP